MAQYGKNNYFDGVILPEPKEETLRRMAKGVKLGYGEKNVYSSSFNGTMLMSSPIQIGTSDFSIEYYGNAYDSGSSPAPLLFNKANLGTSNAPTYFQVYGLTLGRNALNWVTFSVPDGGNITTDSLNLNYSAPDLNTKFHLVITRQGRMINVYIDNTLLASKEQTEIKDLGAFVLGILNSSDVGFARVWNYALPAAEVSALWNNGDPVGYVLPAAMKDLMPVEIVGNNSYTWTGVDDPVYSYTVRCSRYFKIGGIYKVRVTISNWEAGGPPYFKIATDNTTIMSGFTGNGTYAFYITAEGIPYDYMFVYAGRGDTDRRMTITVNSIEPLGCVAEYLPGNLIPTAEGSVIQWLDSAPRLPEANGILLPLDASVGGHDLAAVGTPKIIV